MASRPHRRTILGAAFRDAGAAVVAGNPRTGARGATFAALLGRRGR